MRTYSTNSPEAAARIVALTMLADGHLCKTELDVLERLDAHAQLGLKPAELHHVVHALCEDILATSDKAWGDACRIDPAALAALTAEIDDPALRLRILRLCIELVDADRHLAEGEYLILKAIVEHWNLHFGDLQPPPQAEAARA